MTRRRFAATLLLAGTLLAGCGGGGGSSPDSKPTTRTPPDIKAFLRQPVATPSLCPNQNSTGTGRQSPWQGHVDVSIYLKPSAPDAQALAVARGLDHSTIVEHVYFESRAEAFAEIQRLYTCWAEVAPSQIPASYRVVLKPTATIAQRDTLVAQMARSDGVDSVSCDPALPCTEVVQSAKAQPR